MPECPKCNFENQEGSRFCCACGTKLDMKLQCSNCGTELVAGAKFCTNCGTPVSAKVQGGASNIAQQITVEKAPAISLPRAKRGFYEYFDRFRGALPILKISEWCRCVDYETDYNGNVIEGSRVYDHTRETLWHEEGCYGDIDKDAVQQGYLGNFILNDAGYCKWKSFTECCHWHFIEKYRGTYQPVGRYSDEHWVYDGDYVDITTIDSFTQNSLKKGKISRLIDACKANPLFSMIDSDNVNGAMQYIKRNSTVAVSENPISPLLAATMTRSVAMASIFISSGADVNVTAQEFEGKTPLMIAVSQGDAVMASFLLACGAMSFMPCAKGWLPLHYAACNDANVRCLKLLLSDKDNNANVKNNDGKTALDLARENKAQKCIKLLEEI